jgi:hypothetical protein
MPGAESRLRSAFRNAAHMVFDAVPEEEVGLRVARDVARAVQSLHCRLSGAGRLSELHVAGDTAVFRQISNVSSPK